MRQVTRAATIISHLRDFARISASSHEPVPINHAISNALSFIQQQFSHKNIQVRTELCPDSPMVSGNTIQLEQVFVTLLTNARDALETVPEKCVSISCTAARDVVVVRISDTGIGIPQANLSRIFDPFLTTKPVGEGTGLGLSTSYGIIKEHKGTIEVESSPEKGTTFTIALPVLPHPKQIRPADSTRQMSHQSEHYFPSLTKRVGRGSERLRRRKAETD